MRYRGAPMATTDHAGSLPVARDARAREVLRFWIGDATDGLAPLLRRQQLWFTRDEATDQAIRERFAGLVEEAGRGALQGWAGAPAGWLALLLVLDQFPRNLFRGQARAYAFDPRARQLAEQGIAGGQDLLLPAPARLFCYLPLEHAEDPAAQRRSVALFEALAQAAPAGHEAVFAGWLDYARAHAEVIARFGRFPHRNAALGRTSTPAERDYLATPGAGF